MFNLTTMKELPVYQSSLLSRFPEIIHFVTTRHGGVSQPPFHSLNLVQRNGENPKHVRENMKRIARVAGYPASHIHSLHQVLGAHVVSCDERNTPPNSTETGDALVTNCVDTPLLTYSADCLLVMLFEPDQQIIANIHASWRGTVSRIVPNTLSMLRGKYKGNISRVHAAIAPAIHQCCFEIQDDAMQLFQKSFPHINQFTQKKQTGYFVDLPALVKDELTHAGVPENHIDISPVCTSCTPKQCYSYRRDGDHSGRFGALLAMRSKG